jgi:hypothetical protein
MGCMKETLDLFRFCPVCGKEVNQINIYPFLTLEDHAMYCCGECHAWIDAFITPAEPSEIFTTTGYSAMDRIIKRYGERMKKKMKIIFEGNENVP